ncbi:hypothetical protein B0H65DRAFT_314108 [Neurospora tetraspora]|uniref:Uncharacterized protein n=1 Tax=Neurospora tetraspora TaxID=94610 RepID=A0AAE0MMM2_9PEZI|nr:hypothetical protein B0H65DRAFT_314108 [Neurospora tetraspora]
MRLLIASRIHFSREPLHYSVSRCRIVVRLQLLFSIRFEATSKELPYEHILSSYQAPFSNLSSPVEQTKLKALGHDPIRKPNSMWTDVDIRLECNRPIPSPGPRLARPLRYGLGIDPLSRVSELCTGRTPLSAVLVRSQETTVSCFTHTCGSLSFFSFYTSTNLCDLCSRFCPPSLLPKCTVAYAVAVVTCGYLWPTPAGTRVADADHRRKYPAR